jgi:hypothetical protein
LKTQNGDPVSYRIDREGIGYILFYEVAGVRQKVLAGDKKTLEKVLKQIHDRANQQHVRSKSVIIAAVVSALATVILLPIVFMLPRPTALPSLSPHAVQGMRSPAQSAIPVPPRANADVVSSPAQARVDVHPIFRAILDAPQETRSLPELMEELIARDPILAQGVANLLQRIQAFTAARQPIPEELLSQVPNPILTRMIQELVAAGIPLPRVASAGSTPQEVLRNGPRISSITSFDPSAPSPASSALSNQSSPSPEVRNTEVQPSQSPRRGLTFSSDTPPGNRDINGVSDLPPRESRLWNGNSPIRLRIEGGNLERAEDALSSFGIPLE